MSTIKEDLSKHRSTIMKRDVSPINTSVVTPSKKTTDLMFDAVIDSMTDNVPDNETTDNSIDNNIMGNIDKYTVPLIISNNKHQMTTTEEGLLRHRSTIMKRGVTPRNTSVVTLNKNTN